MIRALSVHLKRVLVLLICVISFAAVSAYADSVESYVDEAVPPTSGTAEGQPLNPGDLTLQDVLRSAPPPKSNPVPLVKPANLFAPNAPATTTPAIPQLKPKVQESATGAMLLQGMQSALGQSGVDTSQPLQAPKMPSDRAASAAAATATAAPQPLVAGVSTAPLPNVATPEAAAQNANGTCTPQTTSWTKTCAEAGYPDNYVGQIHGETRTTCPEGNLQDVWVSNGCVPPDEAGATPNQAPPAPLTTPSTTSAASPITSVGSDGYAHGSCGISNGLAANAKPLYDLCASGRASSVTGDGPWRWNCQGIGGGMTVSCAAPVAANAAATQQIVNDQPLPVPGMEDAQCGSSDGVVADVAPITGLCTKGAPSHVNGTGPWTWACSGTNGGRAAACAAPKRIDGVCGGANGSGADQMPMSDLCNAGYASAVTGNGPWAWTCSGLNGGQAATCAAVPKQNAVCGPASLTGLNEAPKNALCSIGQPGPVSGTGPWSWSCGGLNGGASVSCQARVSINGACGQAHGASTTETPTENLCVSGKPSRVAGSGPWTWTCMGLDGGDTASCTAVRESERVPVPVPPVAPAQHAAASPPPVVEQPVAVAAPVAAPTAVVDDQEMCGSAAELVAIEAPSKNLCKSGTASAVAGRGPWSWTCSDGNNHQASCATLSLAGTNDNTPTAAAPPPAAAAVPATPVAPQAATCGSANGQGLPAMPSDNLCAVGKATPVQGNGPWAWSCVKGHSRASCEAAKIADGECGLANGSVQKYAPTSSLCNNGTPTQVQGSGPWMWTCVGSGGGSSISCSATSQAQTRVDGACGASSNANLSATPAANLCDSGVASGVFGEGPWTWTCSGLNGGIAASCTAQKNTPPAPPPPGPLVNGLCGSANGVAMIVQPMDNLCSTGMGTAVSGNGPWNWNCIGENGGMTVSCTAPLQPPAPISGVCGAANGVPTLTMPRSGLCSGGISSAVSGKGPWTWSCSGVNGGGAVGCVAPLAGNDVGSLPSMTTLGSADTAPAPAASPSGAVTKKGLVTPRLPSGSLPTLQSGNLPPAPMQQGMAAPTEVPQLPDDTEPVTPPPVRDMIQPALALRSDDTGVVLPGNHFVLADDVSTIPFTHGSENYDSSVVPTLDKLAQILQQNSGVRITFTAYADVDGTTPREARRLSLARALALRDYLTSKGISSGRIDVRALGANASSGDLNRVDVKAN